MSTYNIPGVGIMTSSGLTKDDLNVIWQDLVLRMLGVIPSSDTDASAYRQVRVAWPPDGQPDWQQAEDVCFIEATMEPDPYDQIQDQTIAAFDDVSHTQTTVYTRVWRVRFVAYGPNAGDRMRQVKTCLYQWFAHDTLAESNLYLIFELGTPRRNPELFTNDWWERWDFSVRMNEQVTETIVLPSMASVEVIISDADGVVSDQVIVFQNQQGYGFGAYGLVNYR